MLPARRLGPISRSATRSSAHRRLAGVVAFATLASCTTAAGQLAPLVLDNPAPGVYVHYGHQAEMTPENRGDVANIGFVVGSRCVAVIDSGGTYAVGRALRDAIRSVTATPVCYVVNTHVHPDHTFGNAAFADDRPQFVGHVRLADAMQRKAPNYLNALRRDLGAAADGTQIVLPTRAVTATDALDLGGRTLSVRAWRTAHTDTDVTVFDPATRTLWLGDLLFVGHTPVVDGSLRGFLAVLDELRTMDVSVAIPGHGRAGAWPGAIDAEQAYLQRLLSDVRAAIKAKRTLAQAVETVAPDRSDWLLLDAFHKRNVSAAYAELEWEE